MSFLSKHSSRNLLLALLTFGKKQQSHHQSTDVSKPRLHGTPQPPTSIYTPAPTSSCSPLVAQLKWLQLGSPPNTCRVSTPTGSSVGQEAPWGGFSHSNGGMGLPYIYGDGTCYCGIAPRRSTPSLGRVQGKLNWDKCTHASGRRKCLVDFSYQKRHVPVETCHTLGEGDRWRRETCYLSAGTRTSEYKLAIFKFCQNITIRLLAIRTEMLEHYSKTIFGSKTLTILRPSMTI